MAKGNKKILIPMVLIGALLGVAFTTTRARAGDGLFLFNLRVEPDRVLPSASVTATVTAINPWDMEISDSITFILEPA